VAVNGGVFPIEGGLFFLKAAFAWAAFQFDALNQQWLVVQGTVA
jgi:hypothetical protein